MGGAGVGVCVGVGVGGADVKSRKYDETDFAKATCGVGCAVGRVHVLARTERAMHDAQRCFSSSADHGMPRKRAAALRTRASVPWAFSKCGNTSAMHGAKTA